MKWYHDKEGKPSTMRIIAMMAATTGCAAIFAYIIGTVFGVVYDIQLVVAGAGMAGLGEIAKSWQAKSGR